MDGWNEFLLSLTLIPSEEALPLTVGLFRFLGRFQIHWPHLMTGSLLATLVPVALSVVGTAKKPFDSCQIRPTPMRFTSAPAT